MGDADNEEPVERTIEAALDAAADEYAAAKAEFDKSQITFEVAKKRLALTKQLAGESMSPSGWKAWLRSHDKVRYAGATLGQAIVDVLRRHAYQCAFIYEVASEPTEPVWIGQERILAYLRAGGFEFRTLAPLREVNAALINVTGVQKKEEEGLYTVADLDQVLAEASAAAAEELAKDR